MNWFFIVPRAVLALSVWAFFAFGFDPLLRRTAIIAAQQASGTRVDIAKVETKFVSPTLIVQNAALADRSKPGTNLIEFDEFRVQLDGRALLRRAFVAEDAALTGVRWNTPRADAGDFEQLDWGKWLPSVELGEGAEQLGKAALEALLAEARQQLDPRQLESVRLAETLEQEWTDRFDGFETRVRDLETRIKTLEDDVKARKGNTLDQVNQYSRAADEVNRLLREAENLRQELQSLPSTAQIDFGRLEAARDRDLAQLRQKLQILKLDGNALSEALLGDELARRLAEAAQWFRWYRDLSERLDTETEPERMRGVDVIFATRDPLPAFLVRTLTLAGEARVGDDVVPFKGTVTGLTSDPVLLGKPLTLTAEGHGKHSLRVMATYDAARRVPVHTLEVNYLVPHESTLRFGNANGLALVATAGTTEWHGKFHLAGEEVHGGIAVRQTPVTLAVESDAESELAPLLAPALGGIRDIEAVLALSGTLAKPRTELLTTLGPQLAEGFHAALTGAIEATRREAALRLDAEIQKREDLLRQKMGDRYGDLTAQLKLHESSARQIIDKVAGGTTLDLGKALRVLR